MAELQAREAKLVQYLNEAFGKEKELETALQAHIGMTTRDPYRKRLRQHLTETKQHARLVERRIKALGGTAEQISVDAPGPVAAGAKVALEVGNRALAAAQGPLHAIRGTGEQEKMLKNAKTEYKEEHEEIATYTAIEALARTVGDSETAKLASSIRREEESMARFLERQIPALTKAVAQAEIPASQRRASSGKRRAKASAGASRGKAAASRSGASKASRGKAAGAKASSGASARSKAGGSKASGSRAAGGKASSARSSAGKTARSKAGAARTRAKAGTGRAKAGAGRAKAAAGRAKAGAAR